MVAALVDKCREEAVLVRNKTREVSIVRFRLLCGRWWVVRNSGVKEHMLRSD